jgi:hypothetical protein
MVNSFKNLNWGSKHASIMKREVDIFTAQLSDTRAPFYQVDYFIFIMFVACILQARR